MAAADISTSGQYDGYTGFFGFPDTFRWGQTFVAPSGTNYLDKFEFSIHSVSNGPTKYTAYLYEYDLVVNNVTGAALAQVSGSMPKAPGWASFDLPNSLLVAGTQYVVFLQANSGYGAYEFDLTLDTAYAGGSFVYQGSSYPSFGVFPADLEFVIQFSDTGSLPPPSSGGSSESEKPQYNEVVGTAENDVITGTSARDYIHGKAGKDKLIGRGGQDYLFGGAGRDRFIYNRPQDSTIFAEDQIVRFQVGLDKVNLRRIDANDGLSGNQAFIFVQGRQFLGESGELIFVNSRLQGDTNGDGNADFSIFLKGVNSLGVDSLIL